MNASALVALVAAIGSSVLAVVAAVVAARGQQRVTELEHRLRQQAQEDERRFITEQRLDEREHARQEKRQERELAARAQLDRYREPLLDAAESLRHRIDNIRNKAFLTYLSRGERRKKIALLGTSYRLARYLAVVESLRRGVNLLRLERAEDTRVVNNLLTEISTTLSSDRLDGQRLMVWRDEQRAIGELTMEAAPGDVGVSDIGFATFAELHGERFAGWLSGFETDLQDRDVDTSPRLAKLQDLLGQLVDELAKGRTLTV